MTSSLHGKQDANLRIVSSEDAVVFPENAEPTDDSPTIISKTPPIVAAASVAQQQNSNQMMDLSRQALTPESLITSLRGRKLAHYELIEPIGVGGMAAVLRAHDTQLDRFVALKILPPEMAMDNENIRRFHQEAKAAAKLDHENIARVFFCGEDQGLHFIAFEFVEGINLRTMLERRGKIPVAEAIRYVLQVATGLEHATTRGVVHRDVKPSNIIISSNGRAKLVDMGLARNMERCGERDLTQSGVTLGTFDYISPEQALEPREADGRSDVYSLGCTLYHMLTGQPPVPEGTPAKKLHHHQHMLPIDPRQMNPAIPGEVVDVLGKMMAKNPKDRYQRPIHLVHHLMLVAQKVGAADDLPEGVLFVDAPVSAPPRTRPILMIGLALAALVVVTLVLSLAPDSPMPTAVRPNNPPVGLEKNAQAGDLPDVKGPNPAKGAVFVAPQLVEVKNASELQTALADSSTKELRVKVSTEEIVLGNSALTFRGASDQRLHLEPKEPDDRPIIRFQYRQTEGATAGLVLEGAEEIVVRRFKFQMDSIVNPKKDVVASVLVRGVKRVIFDQCIFTQDKVPERVPTGRVALASLLVEAVKGSEYPRPIVILKDCYFGGDGKTTGQDAIVLNGPALVHATSCAFKPHAAFFHFRAESKLHDTEVHLRQCAGFVMQGPVFRFDEKASANLRVTQSVFSNLNTTVSLIETSRPDINTVQYETPRPDLIYLSDNSPVQYVGRKNVYHNLNALVERKNTNPLGKPLFLTRMDEFKKYLDQANGSDVESKEVASSPWQHAQPLERNDELAFQLKPSYPRSNGVEGYGLEGTWMLRPMAEPPGIAKAPAPAKNFKIVDAEDRTPGIYKTIQNALGKRKTAM